MAVFREVPYAGMNFLVRIGGLDPAGVIGGVAEVILPEGRIANDKYRNGNEPSNSAVKVPHQVAYENVTLKRGLIGSLDWYQWWNRVRNGEADVKMDVTVILLNEDRSTPVLEWKFKDAFPVAYQVSPLNAHDPEILIERLELGFKDFFIE